MLALYSILARAARTGRVWRAALAIGLFVGVTRATLASVGWYTVERTGGPLQIPGFLFAMLAWPEAALLGPHRGPASASFFVSLAVLLVLSSVAFAAATAFVAKMRWTQRSRQHSPRSLE